MSFPARFVSCLVVASIPSVALAQQAPQLDTAPVAMSFQSALQASRTHVPSVLSALAQVRVAEGQLTLVTAARLPTVTGAATAGLSGQTAHTWGATPNVPCGTPMASLTQCGVLGTASLDGNIAARWTIWDFGRTSASVDAARLSLRGVASDVHAAERVAMAATAAAYYGLLADQENVDSLAETLQQRDHELTIAVARVNAGSDPEINRTRAQIAVETARLDLSRAQAAVLNDAAGLAATLGYDPARPPTVARPTELVVDDDPHRAADAALAARPEVVSARLRLASAEAGLTAARAGWRPALVANGTLDGRLVDSTAGITQFVAMGSAVQTSWGTTFTASGTVSVGLTVPIYDPTIRANVQTAEGQILAARAVLAEQVLTVRTDAVQAALAVRTAREQLAEAEHNAALTGSNLALAEGRYAAGVAQLLELVDAQAQDATARLAVVQQRLQFERAKVALLASTNQLDAIADDHAQ